MKAVEELFDESVTSPSGGHFDAVAPLLRRYCELAIEAYDAAVSRWAFERLRRLPAHELRTIIALAECPTWHRRQAEAHLRGAAR